MINEEIILINIYGQKGIGKTTTVTDFIIPLIKNYITPKEIVLLPDYIFNMFISEENSSIYEDIKIVIVESIEKINDERFDIIINGSKQLLIDLRCILTDIKCELK